MRSRSPFESVSRTERREADLFCTELFGSSRPRASGTTIDREASEAAELVVCPRHDKRPTVFEATRSRAADAAAGSALRAFVGLVAFAHSWGSRLTGSLGKLSHERSEPQDAT